jgi:hypothetical protein
MKPKPDDQFSDEEARSRFEKAIRVALSGPAKPHSEMKLGKPRRQPSKSPSKRKAAKKASLGQFCWLHA